MLQRSIRSGLQVAGQSTEERKAEETLLPPRPPLSKTLQARLRLRMMRKSLLQGGMDHPVRALLGTGAKNKKNKQECSEIE